MEPERS